MRSPTLPSVATQDPRSAVLSGLDLQASVILISSLQVMRLRPPAEQDRTGMWMMLPNAMPPKLPCCNSFRHPTHRISQGTLLSKVKPLGSQVESSARHLPFLVTRLVSGYWPQVACFTTRANHHLNTTTLLSFPILMYGIEIKFHLHIFER